MAHISGRAALSRRVRRAARIEETERAENPRDQSHKCDRGEDDDRRRGEYLRALVAARGALVLVVVEKVAIRALRIQAVQGEQ